ncbi:MAG TPA: hypothetical protein VF821_21980 [Lentzea sp.]
MTSYLRAMARWKNELYYAGPNENDRLWIVKIDGQDYRTNEVFEQSRDRQLKLVPIQELEEWYREKMTATWKDQPFNVTSVVNGKAHAGYAGGEYVWAAQQGLDGDQYNGYNGTFDVDELENVRVDRTDYLARWKENRG